MNRYCQSEASIGGKKKQSISFKIFSSFWWSLLYLLFLCWIFFLFQHFKCLHYQGVSPWVSFYSTFSCEYITNTFVFQIQIFLLSSRLMIQLLTGHLCACSISLKCFSSLTIPLTFFFFGPLRNRSYFPHSRTRNIIFVIVLGFSKWQAKAFH